MDHGHYLEKIQLKQSISVPSKVHVYSLGVEYMRKWFLDKFDDDYFKTVFINGRHIFDDFRRFNREKIIKKNKPALSITPTVDYEYNRDMVDLREGGLDVLTRRSRFHKDEIIQDRDKNLFLQMTMELVKINFTFRIRVGTRAQQMDLFNYMRFACRSGSTQKAFVDYDFHLPYDMMLNIASHNGFEISYPDKNDTFNRPRIRNITGFLKYINSKSVYPIAYKMRTVNGNCDFFIRVPHMCTHISNLDPIAMDDGEREDQLENNFHLEMNCILSIPSPQIYFFYSTEALDNRFKFKNDIAGLYTIRTLSPPEKDEHGWTEYISTEYVDEDREIESIEFEELLDGTDLLRAINQARTTLISPAVFVNIKLYNAFKDREIYVDWETLTIKPGNKLFKTDISQISIYVDMEYMNNILTYLDEIDKGRFQ